jgi:tRNA(fMet)-specific endonuclease VapC
VKYLLDTDHISFLQRRSSSEFGRLTLRIAQYPISDFALSVISFHEQVIGAHSFINRAQNNTDLARGYALLLETLNGFQRLQFYYLMLKRSQYLMKCGARKPAWLQWT